MSRREWIPRHAFRVTTDRAASAAAFEQHRGALIAIAYRVLGSFADAEDVVQDAWLRWSRTSREDVENPRGFLVRTVTRLAIDRLRRRRARREEYHGEWLPEPLPTDPGLEEQVELADSVSTALLLVLETLSPLERAVFVLREAFGFSHAEVADVVGRNEDAVRQLAHRARQHVSERRQRFRVDPGVHRTVTERFLAACMSGDAEGLMAVLAPDVRLVADSGGKVRAPLLPVVGAEKVTRFLLAAVQRMGNQDAVRIATLNGAPAILVTGPAGPVSATTFEVADGRVRAIYLQGNPDKLEALR
jgi:RNA polymerase sigma-70 factor, ECF subfamily